MMRFNGIHGVSAPWTSQRSVRKTTEEARAYGTYHFADSRNTVELAQEVQQTEYREVSKAAETGEVGRECPANQRALFVVM